jgi:hypothetical protein
MDTNVLPASVQNSQHLQRERLDHPVDPKATVDEDLSSSKIEKSTTDYVTVTRPSPMCRLKYTIQVAID